MFNIGVQVGSEYVLIVLSGQAGGAELHAMNVFVADLLVRTGRRRVLLESLSFTPTLAGDEQGKQSIVAHMRATMPQLERVAVLVPADSRRGFIRGAAAGREFEAAEFTDLVEAERWLLGGD